MNNDLTELLTSLHTEHDRAAARAHELRRQIEHLTAALDEAEDRLAELSTAKMTSRNTRRTAPHPSRPASPPRTRPS